MFLWKMRKNIDTFFSKKVPYQDIDKEKSHLYLHDLANVQVRKTISFLIYLESIIQKCPEVPLKTILDNILLFKKEKKRAQHFMNCLLSISNNSQEMPNLIFLQDKIVVCYCCNWVFKC